jgi:hypothetical protein
MSFEKYNLKFQYHCLTGPAKIDSDGEHWYRNGKKHRTGGPAFIGNDGLLEWYQYGKLHRVGGPAVEDGYHQEWWVKGKTHRIGAPAVYFGERKEWWVDGEIHREDGPAIEDVDCLEWRIEGKLHRQNGPARITIGNKGRLFYQWWINDIRFSPEKEKILNTWWKSKYGEQFK